MARITVEDCLAQIPNRFELTLLAAKRARYLLLSGEEPMVPWENDKSTVVALREIASGLVTAQTIAEQENVKVESAFLSPDEMLAQVAATMAEMAEEEDLSDTDLDLGVEALSITVEEDIVEAAPDAESTESSDTPDDSEDDL